MSVYVPENRLTKKLHFYTLHEILRGANFGEWPLIGSAACVVERNAFPNEQFKDNGYIGGKSYDAGLAAKFLSAYHCLMPWDNWYKPDYLDEFLLSPDLKPLNLMFKKSAQ